MQDAERHTGAQDETISAPEMPQDAPAEESTQPPSQAHAIDESIVDEVAALIDESRTYAQAEIAFQKTRAKLVGRSVGFASAYLAVALVLFHIAMLALAVGMVLALEPLVTIWGAIGIVVGALMLITVLLVFAAIGHGKKIGIVFSPSDEEDTN